MFFIINFVNRWKHLFKVSRNHSPWSFSATSAVSLAAASLWSAIAWNVFKIFEISGFVYHCLTFKTFLFCNICSMIFDDFCRFFFDIFDSLKNKMFYLKDFTSNLPLILPWRLRSILRREGQLVFSEKRKRLKDQLFFGKK